MYKYILFDADNTLLDFDKAEEISISNTFIYFGIDICYSKRFSEINSSLWRLFEIGGIEREEIKTKRFQLLLDELGINNISASEMSEKYLYELSCSSYTYDGAEELCEELAKAGKNLYIITNGHTVTQTKRLKNSNFIKYIKKSFISEQIGYQKPNKEYFDYVLNEINANESECIIIGDSLSSDIKGGINSGIDTCWFNPKNIENTGSVIPTYTVNTFSRIIDILKE
jgi:YjjG family noncanonical pyrimidine nucleotidase